MLDPKKVYVGIFILGGGSIEGFDFDDEQSKRKVNGSNKSTKTPWENPKGNYLNRLRKFQVIYLAKDYLFSNYLFVLFYKVELVLSTYVQNVIPAF